MDRKIFQPCNLDDKDDWRQLRRSDSESSHYHVILWNCLSIEVLGFQQDINGFEMKDIVLHDCLEFFFFFCSYSLLH